MSLKKDIINDTRFSEVIVVTQDLQKQYKEAYAETVTQAADWWFDLGHSSEWFKFLHMEILGPIDGSEENIGKTKQSEIVWNAWSRFISERSWGKGYDVFKAALSYPSVLLKDIEKNLKMAGFYQYKQDIKDCATVSGLFASLTAERMGKLLIPEITEYIEYERKLCEQLDDLRDDLAEKWAESVIGIYGWSHAAKQITEYAVNYSGALMSRDSKYIARLFLVPFVKNKKYGISFYQNREVSA